MTKLELALEVMKMGYGTISNIGTLAQEVVIKELQKKSK